MKKFLIFLSLILLVASFTQTPTYAQTPPAPKPNFIVILADDLGYGDVGIYGAAKIKTPNIDKLAAGGVRFTDFYANSALCCPTRAAFLTGRYSKRVGIDEIISFTGPTSTKGLADSEVTLPEVLKPLGYTSKLVGKWHLGHQPQFNPTLHGFDSFYGLLYSNNYNNGLVPLYNGTQIIENQTDQKYLTSKFTTEALNFINNNKTKPFFLYLAYTAPHAPLFINPDFAGKSQGGLYGDVVEEMDWGVGQVINKVVELGLAGKTIIVFASDNGPALYEGANGGNAGPFYCGKGTYYEGGIRVPFIVNYPGKINPGKIINKPAALFDLFPTFVKLAGGANPPGKVIDGQDIGGLLFASAERADDDFYFSYQGILRAVRMDKWKYLASYQGGQTWMGACAVPANPDMLFNLKNDPGEKTNLSTQQPGIFNFLKTELTYYQISLNQANNTPPVANFTASTGGANNQTVTFNAIASKDPDGTISSYQWNFGDGTTGSGANVSHTYPQKTTYYVFLTVTDNQGLKDGKIYELNLTGGPTVTPSPTPPQNSPTPSSTLPIGGKPGDANNDNKVDGLDYVIWLNHYNQSATGAENGDFNNSGKVDGLDYVIWLNNYNK